RDRLARQQRRAPAHARRQRNLGVALSEQRIADHIIERAIEISAAIKERAGAADDFAEMGDVRRPDGGNPCGDRRIGRNHVGEDRYELVAITHHLPSAHIEIETRYELAVAARSYEQRPA